MELDDDVFPSQLEQLLPELREDDPFQDDIRFDTFISSLMGTDTDTYQENIPVHIRHLLDAVPEDDPLRDHSLSKPHLPSLKGKILDHCDVDSYLISSKSLMCRTTIHDTRDTRKRDGCSCYPSHSCRQHCSR